MPIRCALLLAAILLFLPQFTFADSVGASGTYQVTGTVTMTGAITGPCGASPCVETLNFSAVVTASQFDFFGTTAYFDVLSNGAVSSSGPIAGPWNVGVWQGYDVGFVGFYFISSSVPDLGNFNPSEIDAFGFNSPTGLPHSFNGPAYFYSCAAITCTDFGFQASGIQSISVTQTPEPNSLVLLALGGFCILVISLARRSLAPAKPC